MSLRKFSYAFLTIAVVGGALITSAWTRGSATVGSSNVATIVLPGYVMPDQEYGSAAPPFPFAWPPTEGVQRYKVPKGQRLVIESAYASVQDQTPEDPAGARAYVAASLMTSYDLGSTCAFPGYERDYWFDLTTPVAIVRWPRTTMMSANTRATSIASRRPGAADRASPSATSPR